MRWTKRDRKIIHESRNCEYIWKVDMRFNTLSENEAMENSSTTANHYVFKRIFSSSLMYSCGENFTLLIQIILYFSQKELPCKITTRLVITQCAGYIFWQFFFCEKYTLYFYYHTNVISARIRRFI